MVSKVKKKVSKKTLESGILDKLIYQEEYPGIYKHKSDSNVDSRKREILI